MYDDDETQYASRQTRERRPRRQAHHRNNDDARSSSQQFNESASSSAEVGHQGEEINPLIKIANPLLAIGISLSRQEVAPDTYQLKNSLVKEVQYFQQQLRGNLHDLINDATYILCTFLDENIMYRPWGNDWGQKPLLLEFCGDNQGGEKFFIKLDEVQQRLNRPSDAETRDGLIYLLELIYVCLSFGYGGKYKLYNKKEELGEIKVELYHFIDNFRNFSHSDKPLSLHWQGTPTHKIKSRWQYALLAFALILAILGGLYYYSLNHLDTRKFEVSQELDIAQANLKLINGKHQFDIESIIPDEPLIIDKPIPSPVAKLLREKQFVFFRTGKHRLDSPEKNKIDSFLNKLENLCQQLNRSKKQVIKINLLGRASSKGNAKFNQWLSEKRAKATANYLNAQVKSCFFVEAVTDQGLGANSPISNKGSLGRAESNQSVEITVTEVK